MFKLPLGHICNVAIARRAHQGYLPSATDEMTSLAAACCCCLAQSPSPSRRQSLSAGDLIEHVAWAPRGVVESEDGDRLSLSYSALSSESAAGSTSVFYHPSLSIAKRRAQHSSRRCLKVSTIASPAYSLASSSLPRAGPPHSPLIPSLLSGLVKASQSQISVFPAQPRMY
ncbi:hypothetical protein L226DRAFT_185275 [Lentinus tigrinus ALCF2SS1-7]|uniref:uncharacterized protein n=1 Tax=Lentinus tigrinus ALCF2SS1-7 TaxID=1328758 RepID=UPI001165E7B0|nr:hypothetical protein L226DRAFT_185275 [Lentinus tigrinus ALCF2SS1-7]